jgi:hypothetical protein
VIRLQLLKRPAVPAPIRKAMAKLNATPGLLDMPSWAMAVIIPKASEGEERAMAELCAVALQH